MKNARQIPLFTRTIIWGLLVASLVMVWAPQPGIAMLAPTSPEATAAGSETDRVADLQKVQRVLESKIIQQRLEDFGLTPEEITARLNGLSNAQLHQTAAQIDALMPGGDLGITGILVVVLIIILLVILL